MVNMGRPIKFRVLLMCVSSILISNSWGTFCLFVCLNHITHFVIIGVHIIMSTPIICIICATLYFSSTLSVPLYIIALDMLDWLPVYQCLSLTEVGWQWWCFYLSIQAPITTKFVCFSCLLKCFKSLLVKHCGPRSDCSHRSSLTWLLTVCLYTVILWYIEIFYLYFRTSFLCDVANVIYIVLIHAMAD